MKGLQQPKTKVEIIARLEKLRLDSQRQFGKMNAHQAICHLTDSFKAVSGQRNRSSRPMPAWQRAMLKWVALYLPVKWATGVKTPPENDQELQGTPPTSWDTDKAELLEWIETFSTGNLPLEPHLLFGKLTSQEWQRWGYLHCDHHLRQFGV